MSDKIILSYNKTRMRGIVENPTVFFKALCFEFFCSGVAFSLPLVSSSGTLIFDNIREVDFDYLVSFCFQNSDPKEYQTKNGLPVIRESLSLDVRKAKA